MKKLIAPALLVLTVFASCSKDEIKTPTKADILTTNVEMSIKDSKSLTGKKANSYGIEGGQVSQQGSQIGIKTSGGQDIVAGLKDIYFQFTSQVYAGYTTDELYPTATTNSFSVPDVALGSNILKVTAKSSGNDSINGIETNKFISTPPAFSINTIADFKSKVLANDPKPYLEYETTQLENIVSGGNSISVALQPVTGKIATGFRLSNNDIENGISYKVVAHNNTMNTDVIFNGYATTLGLFESHNKDAKTGNSIVYDITIYDINMAVLKTFNVTEDFLNGKSVNTIYFFNKNSIYKDTATITLSLLDLGDNDTDKPLD